jgi:lipoprotein signal peptidase
MPGAKKRHIIVTIYFGLVIAANTINAAVSAVAAYLGETIRELPPQFLWLVSVLSCLHVGFALAMLSWKRWGFYGFCASGAIGIVILLIAEASLVRMLEVPLGLLIMFVILQIGRPKSVWAQME